MLGQRPEQLPPGNLAPPAPEVSHVRSGAVGAMGKSLGRIVSAAENAKALIAAGSAVIEIPTHKLAASFVSDRFGNNGPDHFALVEAIRQRGQQVPILVRPHPTEADRYQIAYGHRRVRALAELDRPARAVVRELTDEELVVAQGQENSARTDLSYIERARFAIALSNRGFDRAVVMAALNMEKTQLSKLLSIGRSIPADVADAIGSAPKAGRPRWATLAKRFETGSRGKVDKLLFEPRFLVADSDMRFNRVLSAMSVPAVSSKSTSWKNPEGEKIAVIQRGDGRLALVIGALDFGEYVAEQLPELYRAFKEQAA